MKMIAGRIKPDAGTITVGATIKIGYYTQEIETGREAGIAYMDPEEKVIDYIRNTAEYVRTTDGLVSASNMLERFCSRQRSSTVRSESFPAVSGAD